eukprot:CAMPEP_0174256740 /NCGR_PEP_ID=MMETSP0439-20130205/5944_1 /TAXON_ID=0 /ORGANISM="Stereomyxa ramosa, Strain Chinc5" /LENGTH=170 /DNA_ID=CAMNT_0015339489 /DNA_START=109 /DNA_END=618 /DNA_ORIENTATION=-
MTRKLFAEETGETQTDDAEKNYTEAQKSSVNILKSKVRERVDHIRNRKKREKEERMKRTTYLQQAFEAFQKIDRDDDNLITVAELEEVLLEANLETDSKQLEKILALASLDGSRFLDFEEFYSIFVGAQLYKQIEDDFEFTAEELISRLEHYGLDPDETKVKRMLCDLNI